MADHEIEEIAKDLIYADTASGDALKRHLYDWLDEKEKSAQS